MTREFFICSCGSTEHQLVITQFDGEPETFVLVHLRPLPLHKRLLHGLKYIFGHRSRYGDFDEFIFDPDDADKLQMVVDRMNKEKKYYENPPL